jgi:hypothetical protein
MFTGIQCLLIAAIMGGLAESAFSQGWTEPYASPTATGDCKGLPGALNTDFAIEPIVSDSLFKDVAPYRIDKMAFALKPGAQNADLYIAEKGSYNAKARVLFYDGTAHTLKVIGTLPQAFYGGTASDEQGLLGIALDSRSFFRDRFMYLYYSIGTGNVGSNTVGARVTRVPLDPATNEIDFSSEKVLLHIPAGTTGRWFAGGGLAFDNAGNLYLSVGDNESAFKGPANTADLRGSILRIRPDTANVKGYAIPPGNFGEYWANRFETQGKTGLAARYRDTAKVKPELYIKGLSNVFSFTVDPIRPGRIAWGQCGPDIQRGETHSISDHPAFGGWPFWVSNNGGIVRQSSAPSYYDEPGEPPDSAWKILNPPSMSPDLPINGWEGNPGVDTLPPYHRPFFAYNSGSAAGGPIIQYDGSLSSPGKMPPHLDKSVFVTNFDVGSGTNSIWAGHVDDSGKAIGNFRNVFTMTRTGRPSLYNSVDFQQGPDGTLYLADWGGGGFTYSPPREKGGIVRISYTGTCQDPGLTPTSTMPKRLRQEPGKGLHVEAGRIFVPEAVPGYPAGGRHRIRILSLRGKLIRSFTGEGRQEYPIPPLPSGQVYILRAEMPHGVTQQLFRPL